MKRELTYVDFIRVVCIGGVIFAHTNAINIYASYDNAVCFLLYGIISVFVASFSVPCFFMISGGLLLNRTDDSFCKNYKRIRKIACSLIVMSIWYYLMLVNYDLTAISFWNFWNMLYGKYITPHLWYLYTYLSFLLILPLLQTLVQNMKNHHFIYLISLNIIFAGILPTFEFFSTNSTICFSNSFQIRTVFCDIFLYPIVGYFLMHRVPNISKKSLLTLLGVNFLLLMF